METLFSTGGEPGLYDDPIRAMKEIAAQFPQWGPAGLLQSPATAPAAAHLIKDPVLQALRYLKAVSDAAAQTGSSPQAPQGGALTPEDIAQNARELARAAAPRRAPAPPTPRPGALAGPAEATYPETASPGGPAWVPSGPLAAPQPERESYADQYRRRMGELKAPSPDQQMTKEDWQRWFLDNGLRMFGGPYQNASRNFNAGATVAQENAQKRLGARYLDERKRYEDQRADIKTEIDVQEKDRDVASDLRKEDFDRSKHQAEMEWRDKQLKPEVVRLMRELGIDVNEKTYRQWRERQLQDEIRKAQATKTDPFQEGLRSVRQAQAILNDPKASKKDREYAEFALKAALTGKPNTTDDDIIRLYTAIQDPVKSATMDPVEKEAITREFQRIMQQRQAGGGGVQGGGPPPQLTVGTPVKQGDGRYQIGNQVIVVRNGKVAEIR